jgi:hypothetical protein
MELGYNTSTVALVIAEIRIRQPRAWSYSWATLFLGNMNTGT